MKWLNKVGISFAALISRVASTFAGVGIAQRYRIECRRADGSIKWVEDFTNLVTAEGLNDWLAKYWNGNTYTAAHYVGLTDGTPTVAAGDTMASHAGWVEITAFTEAVRQTLNMGTAATGSIDNDSNRAVYSINADATVVGGVFISTSGVKGGSAGLLVAVGAFTNDKTVDSGESLTVLVTSTMTSI